MEQETTQELARFQAHGLRLGLVGIVFVEEAYSAGVDVQQPMIADGDAVGVGAEVADDLLGSGEGPFGVDDPVVGP